MATRSRANLQVLDGGVPEWVTPGVETQVTAYWERMNGQGPAWARRVFVPGEEPIFAAMGAPGDGAVWGGKAGLARRLRVADIIAGDAKTAIRSLETQVLNDRIDLASWAQGSKNVLDRFCLAGAQLGAGMSRPWESPTVEAYLSDLRRRQHDAVDRFVDGVRTQRITMRQAGAWAGANAKGAVRASMNVGTVAAPEIEDVEALHTTIRGGVKASFEAGGLRHVGREPVRWVLAPEDAHCTDCPRYAATYENLDKLLRRTGGLPGDSDSECHGNCKCHVEPAVTFSVLKRPSSNYGPFA